MDKTTKNLYKLIASGNFAEANTVLGEILEAKSGERIKTVLKSTEEI